MSHDSWNELLSNFISCEIMNNKTFDTGTKILYLERAIRQDRQTFLKSLDKLYNPKLEDSERKFNIKFILALKLINDICFDNKTKYDKPSAKIVHIHHFSSISASDIQLNIRTVIKEIINNKISEISKSHRDKVAAQQQARKINEANIKRQSGWRTKKNLTLAKLTSQTPYFQMMQAQLVEIDTVEKLNGALTDRHFL
jgi:hypothetical protein